MTDAIAREFGAREGRPTPSPGSFVHEALIYSSDDEFLAAIVPFVRAGLAAGHPCLAVVSEAKFALLREGLGADARDVAFMQAGMVYRRPANAIVAYRRRVTELWREGIELMRCIGEVQFGANERERAEWTAYEWAANRAMSGWRVWMVCPYDTRALPDRTIDDARRTHPFVSEEGGQSSSTTYVDPERLTVRPVARATDRVRLDQLEQLSVAGESGLAAVRGMVARSARAARLAPEVVDDVTVAVNELARETLAVGEGQARVRVGRAGIQWLAEVTDCAQVGSAFHDDDPGLWIADLICQQVGISTGVDGVSVRLSFATTPPDARRRILDAAAELFYQQGVRATGVNAIIAASGVAKATFYRHFPSKDALVVAWLRRPETRWFDQVRVELEARTAFAGDRLLTLFDVVGEWLAQSDFRGSAFMNVLAELAEGDHPARLEALEYELEIREYLRRTAVEAGIARPASHAEQLHLLVSGAIALAVATRSPAPARGARDAATHLQSLARST